MEFILKNLPTILAGTVLLAMVTLIVLKMFRDKKKGKSSCGGCCNGCPSAGMCHPK